MFEAFDEDMNMIDKMGKVYCVVVAGIWLLFLKIFDEFCMNVHEYDVEDDEEERWWWKVKKLGVDLPH